MNKIRRTLFVAGMLPGLLHAAPCDDLWLDMLNAGRNAGRATLSTAQDLWAKLTVPKAIREFNGARFDESLQTYRRELASGLEPTKATGFEDQLAYLEATLDGAPLTDVQKTAIAKLVKKTKLEKGLTPTAARHFATKLYRIRRADPETLHPVKDALNRQSPLDGYITRRLESEISRHGLEKALASWDVVRPPNSPQEKARDAVRNAFGPITHAWSIAINLYTASSKGAFGYAPPIKAIARGSVDAALLERGLREGLPAVKEEFRKLYGNRAAFDVAWETFSQSYNLIGMATLTAVGLSQFEDVRKEMEKRQDDYIEQLSSVQSDEEFQDEMLKKWIAESTKKYGHAPSSAEIENARAIIKGP